jgi:hypothetical protein
MINEARNYTLAILNKENNGYITPDEFNLFAHQAQLDVYLEYERELNEAVQKMNARMSGSDYANTVGRIEALMDRFNVPNQVLTFAGGSFQLPSDWYKVNYPKYQGFKIEYVSQGKITELNEFPSTAPTTVYPAYTQSGDLITVYPLTIQSNVTLNYLRYPAIPKWTYIVVPGSDAPLFNIAANDYQDFELPESDMMKIIVRICQYAGVSIREEQVVAMAKSEELQDKQEQ